MNLYIAMARYAGIDAAFQTVAVRPEWDKRGELLILSRHINASGSLGYKRKYIVDFTPEIQLQQLTAEIVSDLHARRYSSTIWELKRWCLKSWSQRWNI